MSLTSTSTISNPCWSLYRGSIPLTGVPGRKVGTQSVAIRDLARPTFEYMEYRNPFADAPAEVIQLNIGLWSLAIGAIFLELGQIYSTGVLYYGIAPPLMGYGVYKIVLISLEEVQTLNQPSEYG